MFAQPRFLPARLPGSVAAALPVLAVVLLAAASADAACEKTRRIDHRGAECLSAEWNNRGTFKKNSFSVRNLCADYGKVVAKVDLEMASDRTLHLTDGLSRRGRTGHRIRRISCCPDVGDLCNRSDAVTAEGCVARFEAKSSAAATCLNATAVPAISGDDFRCTVTAECARADSQSGGRRRTTISVAYTDMEEVRNCDGRLKSMPCRAGLSVADARVRDGDGWSLLFRVTLPAPRREVVRVDYATSDGTAIAGVDYVAARGSLAFAPGETWKRVTVGVIHDHRPGRTKTMRLTLSNPRGAPIFHGTATGTIADLPHHWPRQWLSGFGRAVAGALVDRLGERLTDDDPVSHVALGGHRIRLPRRAADADGERLANRDPTGDPGNDRDSGAGVHATSGRAFLLGSAFSFHSGEADERWSGWGEAASLRFGQGDGGEGFVGLAGTDYQRGRLRAGVALSRAAAGDKASGIRASLDGVHPYARLTLGDGLSVWGALGFGSGDLALDGGPGGAEPGPGRQPDIGLAMAAAGMRGALVAPEEADGVALSVKSDAFLVRVTSGAAEVAASRLRLLLEGARGIAVGPDRRLTVAVEGGLRQEAGDGAAGAGVAAGGRLHYAAPGLDAAVAIGNAARPGAEDRLWRASVSVIHRPRAAAGHLPRVSLSPSWEARWGGAARPEHRVGIRVSLPLGPG